MKYELILFDADETLFDFKKAEKQALERTMFALGLDYQENVHLPIYKKVNTGLWRELEDGLITQNQLKTERFKRFSTAIEVKCDEHNFSKLYTEFLGQGSFLFDDSIKLIKSIYQHCKLMIITNGLTTVQDNRIRKSEIAKYFDEIIVSEDIGVSKPNPKIFEYSVDKIQEIDKSKILMVGDSLSSDIQGGINFGIDTCWYNPNNDENTGVIKPTFEIKSLMDLSKLLKIYE